MAYLVALGCLGTALVVLLDGEVDLTMGGFGVGLETEFTLVLVKEKGLGRAGALREPIDSNSSFASFGMRSDAFFYYGRHSSKIIPLP